MSTKEETVIDRGRDRLKRYRTQSGFSVKPVYYKEDISGIDMEKDLGVPGSFPYTRGRHPEMYRKLLWLKHKSVGFQKEDRTGDREKLYIKIGMAGLRLAPSHATQVAVDPDHPLAKNDIGHSGPPRYSLKALEKEFHGIALPGEGGGTIEVPNAPGPSDVCIYTLLIALAEKRGVDISKFRGSGVNDPIESHIIGWLDVHPLELGYKLTIDSMEFSVKNTPLFIPVSPCAYNLRESGINVIQELAFNMAERIAYIDGVIERGVKFEEIGSRIPLAFSGEIDFFETICKLRAARKMWAKIAQERYKVTDVKYLGAKCNIKTAGSSLTAQQPINNIARITLESLSGVLGGVQSIECCGYDEPLSLPSEEAEQINMGISNIIAHESGVPLVADPLGGSYYVEWLTDKIEREATSLLQKILDMGGILEAVKKGWAQEEVSKAALEYQMEINEKKRIVVGVNEFKVSKEDEVPMPSEFVFHDAEVVQKKVLEEIAHFKKTRDTEEVASSLREVYKKALKGENLIRPMVDAFKTNATMGEVMGVIREGMGFSYDPFGMIKRPDFLSY